MYELKVSVARVLGTCTADPPMKPGQYFTVTNGDIRIPQGSFVCAWALHSLLPLITPKERKILESPEDDWIWRVHQAQCPDPDGRVVFDIEPVGDAAGPTPTPVESTAPEPGDSMEGDLWNLRGVVHDVQGKCTSGMSPGDYFELRSGRLYIPAHRHFCLYALQAAFPFLAAKQRPLPQDDWLNRTNWIHCPDPAGRVIVRIERMDSGAAGS